jgi:hypothetical protein
LKNLARIFVLFLALISVRKGQLKKFFPVRLQLSHFYLLFFWVCILILLEKRLIFLEKAGFQFVFGDLDWSFIYQSVRIWTRMPQKIM